MPHVITKASFASEIEAAPQRDGSRNGHARIFEKAIASETDRVYVRHRGGQTRFVRILDDQRIAFADYADNMTGNQRVALNTVDYTQRSRLKLFDAMAVQPLADDKALAARRATSASGAPPQRAMVIRVEAFDWTCSQRIALRLDADDMQRAPVQRDARIADFESRLKALQAEG